MIRRTILSSIVIGTVLLLTTNQLAAAIDISSYFNWDTIINDQSETAMTFDGYRFETNNEYFVTEAGSASITGGDGIDGDGSDIPNDGLVFWGVHSFQMGTLTGINFNTILMDNDGASPLHQNSVTIDIANSFYGQLAVLHSSVALGTQENGTVTINYTDGSSDIAEWDNGDWNAGSNTTKIGMSTPVVGNLYGNSDASDGIDFYRYQSSTIADAVINTNSGRLYAQAFAVDPLRTVDSLTFTIPESAGGDVGIYALSGSAQSLPELASVSVDISAYFNQDTIINASEDGVSQGYRPSTHNEYFTTEAGSASIAGGDGIDGDGSDIPNNGQISSGLVDFTLGPLTGNEANTILMDNDSASSHPSSIELDITDASFGYMSVLYTGIAVADGQDGQFTVVYTDSSQATYDWDLGDWNTTGEDGLRESVLGPGLDFYRNNNSAIINTADGNLFTQYFNLDDNKTVDKVLFSLDADVSSGADIGIYALTGIGEVDDAIPGDANHDGKVDGSDVTILANNWQAGVSAPDPNTITWEMGDFNGDGKVDGSDVTILANNWQTGVTTLAASVPEPSMLVLLMTTLLLFGFRKRRTNCV